MAFNRVIGFPDGSNIGSTVYIICIMSGRNTSLYCILCRDTNKAQTKDTMRLDYSSICHNGSRIGWVSMKEIFKS